MWSRIKQVASSAIVPIASRAIVPILSLHSAQSIFLMAQFRFEVWLMSTSQVYRKFGNLLSSK